MSNSAPPATDSSGVRTADGYKRTVTTSYRVTAPLEFTVTETIESTDPSEGMPDDHPCDCHDDGPFSKEMIANLYTAFMHAISNIGKSHVPPASSPSND